MREGGVDETSRESWAAGRQAQGNDVRFEPRTDVQDGGAARSQSGDGDVPADIVFIVKQDGTILYLNRAVGGTADTEIPGTSVYSYTDPAWHDGLRDSLERVFAASEVSGYECAGVEPFKRGSWYQCRVAPNVREGKVVSATIIARDITRWKTEQDELCDERDRLKAELEKVSHDLASLTNTLAERECHQNELDRFRRIIDQAGEAIFITDPNSGKFVDVNETACRWLGFPRDRLLTLGVNDLDLEFALESPNGVAEHVTDTRNPSRPRMVTGGAHRRRNGTSFPVEVAIARRTFGDREYMLVVARDVKERHHAQLVARESEDKFRSLFELSRDAIYLSARDGTVAEVNEAAIELFGYSRTEFIGLEGRELYAHSEDIRAFQSGVSEAGAVRDLEIEFRTKQGTSFTGLLTAAFRHDGDGYVSGYQCIIRPVGTNGRHTEVTPDVDAAATAAEPVDARAGETTGTGVLAVDSDKRVLMEVRTVLEHAGIAVLTSRTLAAGVEVLRAQGEDVSTVLLGVGDEDIDVVSAVQELRAMAVGAHIVVMCEEPDLEPVRDATDSLNVAVIPKPLHPLALIQHVRDSRAEQGDS
jgi:PAS domain S-box-containing protein